MDGTLLHQNLFHPCGNGTTGFHWIPSASFQAEQFGAGEIADTTSFQLWVKGNSSCSSTITSLNEAASITIPGLYCFDISGTPFDTHVDANGYVQVAIDFGNGTGDLPQSALLTTSTRGILTSTVLAVLSGTQEVRFSSSTGNVDVSTTDATIISRIQSNTTLHQGVADNSINNSWTGTNATYLTDDGSCTTVDGTSLHQNLFHPCGNSTTGFHWIPSSSFQAEQFGAGEVGDGTSFQLWVKGEDGALPIELLAFEAYVTGDNQVRLEWQTATEINNDYFTIECSSHTNSWEVVTTINGAGNSASIRSYKVSDTNPKRGVSYYRLKQTDFDGQFSYSKIKKITTKGYLSTVDIYPNPTKDVISIPESLVELEKIRIFNSTGQQVMVNGSTAHRAGSNVSIDLSQLGSGIYFVTTNTAAYKIFKK